MFAFESAYQGGQYIAWLNGCSDSYHKMFFKRYQTSWLPRVLAYITDHLGIYLHS